MQNNFIQTVDLNYTDDQLLAYIENKDRIYLSEAVELGKQDGFKERPQKKESLNTYRDPIYCNYNLLNSEVHQKLQAGIQLRFGKLDIDETKIANQKLSLVIDQLKSKLNSFNFSNKPFPFGVIFQFVVAVLVTMALWIGELEFIVKSLGLLGSGIMSNRLLALGISTGIMIIAHYSKRWTDTLTNRLLNRIAMGVIIFLIIIIFMALGLLRQSYFTQSEIQLPLWVFVSLNLLFFLGFYLVAIYFLQPALVKLKEAIAEIRQAREIRGLHLEIKQVEQEILSNSKKLNESNRLRIGILSFAKATQGLIQRKYERALSSYLNANQSVRDDFYTPDPNESPLKLDMNYEDINV